MDTIISTILKLYITIELFEATRPARPDILSLFFAYVDNILGYTIYVAYHHTFTLMTTWQDKSGASVWWISII